MHKQANLWVGLIRVSITVAAFISRVRDCKRDKEGDIRRSLVLKPINHDIDIYVKNVWRGSWHLCVWNHFDIVYNFPKFIVSRTRFCGCCSKNSVSCNSPLKCVLWTFGVLLLFWCFFFFSFFFFSLSRLVNVFCCLLMVLHIPASFSDLNPLSRSQESLNLIMNIIYIQLNLNYTGVGCYGLAHSFSCFSPHTTARPHTTTPDGNNNNNYQPAYGLNVEEKGYVNWWSFGGTYVQVAWSSVICGCWWKQDLKKIIKKTTCYCVKLHLLS